MDRRTCLVLALALGLGGCSGKSTTSPSATSTPPAFTAVLAPANEVPAVVPPNVDAGGNGSVVVTLNVTKDSSGNVTAATADFAVTLTGFPNNTTLTGAHIHQAVAGATAGVLVSTGIATGDVVLANGAGSFTRTGITVDPAVAQAIINGPAGYYFNVHTVANPSGAARGQLAVQH